MVSAPLWRPQSPPDSRCLCGGALQGAIAANDKYICNILDPTQHLCLIPLTSTTGSAVSSYITWLWAISAQMVWLAAVLAASSARLQHHQVVLSSVFFSFFRNSCILDTLGRQVGDFGNVSVALLLSVTRRSKVFSCSLPMMAKPAHTKVKVDIFCEKKSV